MFVTQFTALPDCGLRPRQFDRRSKRRPTARHVVGKNLRRRRDAVGRHECRPYRAASRSRDVMGDEVNHRMQWKAAEE
jgi:hypothetical protein